jgi:hypothetical protein
MSLLAPLTYFTEIVMKTRTIAATLVAGLAALAALSTSAFAGYDVALACKHSALACRIATHAQQAEQADQQAKMMTMHKEETRPSMASKQADRNPWKVEPSAP